MPGGVVHFPKDMCSKSPLKVRCTTSTNGRSVSIHPDEARRSELRERQQTPQGRAQLRERVAVEHTLAHLGRGPGTASALSWHPQESLRSAKLGRRPQLTRSGSFPATLCGVSGSCVISHRFSRGIMLFLW